VTREGTVTQKSTRPARAVKGPTPAQVLRRGDHGVGVLADGEGEFIVVGGRCFTLRPDGSVAATRARSRAYSAAVTRLQPDYNLTVRRPRSLSGLLADLDREIPEVNAVAAIRIDAWFSFVSLTASDRGPGREWELSDVVGTVVGFRNVIVDPEVRQDDDDPHLHFVDDQRSRGGHLVDFEILRARVLVGVVTKVRSASGF
jgi:acetolactate decarboxylase